MLPYQSVNLSTTISLLLFPLHDASLLPPLRASLWSSCVVLPLLALTWMSAVLAMTDKRSILFQILFAVFDSLQGFVIVMVHCVLRREVRGDTKSPFLSLSFIIFYYYFRDAGSRCARYKLSHFPTVFRGRLELEKDGMNRT